MIPSIEMCTELMDRFEMPDHIRRHSLVVESAAVFLVDAHIHAGAQLSREMVQAGALLHDIAKASCLNNGRDHAMLGGEICVENRFFEISHIVAEHVRLRDFSPGRRLSEKEIVFYADKRVSHDKIVSLDERLLDLIERYGRGREDIAERIRVNFEVARDVELKIFSGLGFTPEDLHDLLNEAGNLSSLSFSL